MRLDSINWKKSKCKKNYWNNSKRIKAKDFIRPKQRRAHRNEWEHWSSKVFIFHISKITAETLRFQEGEELPVTANMIRFFTVMNHSICLIPASILKWKKPSHWYVHEIQIYSHSNLLCQHVNNGTVWLFE